MADGHIFWSAGKDLVDEYLKQLALRRGLPPCDPETNRPWPARLLIEQGYHQRLLAYERAVKRMGKQPKFVINLHQNPAFMNGMTEFVPTLLTKTSMMWSMPCARPLLPLEAMQANVPA